LSGVLREPPITIAPDFQTVDAIKGVITTLDYGQFMYAAWLIEQMWWNSRLRGITNTRMDGLVGTPIRWQPGRENRDARAAARDIVTDWPLIASTATRKQISKWGLNLGVCFAQMHWYKASGTRRQIPKLETYHPQWGSFDWSLRAYRVFTQNAGWVIVPSPALSIPGEQWQPPDGVGAQQMEPADRWVVHEPFGQHSWRDGLVHSAWDPWFGLTLANRNMHRSSEKMGLGIAKVKYPKSVDKTALNLLISKMRRLGREAVIPVEQYGPNTTAGDDLPMANYDVEPFEWTQTGADIITRDRESCLSDLAILYLGHNTTAETKGASVGASAQVGNNIRGDIRVGDCYSEFATMYGGPVRAWAERNYGDPGNAPIPIYVTEDPSENTAASTTLFNVANAIDKLRQSCPGIDFDELLNRFGVPLQPGGCKLQQPLVPPAPSGAGKTPPAAPHSDPEPATDGEETAS